MAVDAARSKSLFLAASDLPDGAERAAYLDRECGSDAALRVPSLGLSPIGCDFHARRDLGTLYFSANTVGFHNSV